ncbi:MAG: cytidine deaminase [Lachnospiraceae bacterium]|nr:cytidine deaminase [Lachnospiraceae bacterium]
MISDKDIIRAALDARKKAYAPYSKFYVGAALVTQNNKIFTGCNIENSSYGATNCAERTAIFKAISEGEKKFTSIAIAGGKKLNPESYAFPCGICRQVMREFTNPKDFRVIVAVSEENYKVYTLEQLLPDSFGPENLEIHN